LQPVTERPQVDRLLQIVPNVFRTVAAKNASRLLSRSLSAEAYRLRAYLTMTANLVSPSRKRTKSDLVHLRALPSTEPATGTGRVAWIWPEIEAALGTGKKLREVWDAARADGFDIPYPQFRVYVSRLRNRLLRHPPAPAPQPCAADKSAATSDSASPVASDPFRNLREQRERKQSAGFEYDPFSIQKQLID
jgi:hypothetical protein